VNDSRAWTRPRLLLALLLAALVAGAVPVRMAAARRDKPSGTASWRAAVARPVAVRPDVDPRAASLIAAAAPEPLPLPKIIRAGTQPTARSPHPVPPLARSPLPRAPPAA
jgi:hypothetical protein